MTRSLGRLAIAVATAWVAVLLAPPVPAAAHGPDPILGGGLFSSNQVLQYRWSGTGPAAWKAAVRDGVADANATRRAKAPSFAYDAGGANAVYYGTDVPCGVNGLACMRRNAPFTFGIWFRENGHRFDWGTLRWCEVAGSPDGCYEVENVMLDELGHVMILDHHANFDDDRDFADAVVQTYSRTKPKAGWNAHAYGRCDVATLQQKYDVANASTPYSTCLDVPSTLSLGAADTTLTSGSLARFTATLRSAGTGPLADNLVTSRTVVLQQRLTAGWSDLGTMSPGTTAGTYALSVTAAATRDYRAVFRKPSTEGLRGSISGTVTITVGQLCTQPMCPVSVGRDR